MELGHVSLIQSSGYGGILSVWTVGESRFLATNKYLKIESMSFSLYTGYFFWDKDNLWEFIRISLKTSKLYMMNCIKSAILTQESENQFY